MNFSYLIIWLADWPGRPNKIQTVESHPKNCLIACLAASRFASFALFPKQIRLKVIELSHDFQLSFHFQMMRNLNKTQCKLFSDVKNKTRNQNKNQTKIKTFFKFIDFHICKLIMKN